MKLDRAKLEKIGIFATLASAAVGVYLYERQKSASAASPPSTDLSDPYASYDLGNQPAIMPSQDSSASSGSAITLPGVPDYSNGGNGSGATVPIDTSPVPGSSTGTYGSLPTSTPYVPGVQVLAPAGATTTNSHTAPVAVTGVTLKSPTTVAVHSDAPTVTTATTSVPKGTIVGGNSVLRTPFFKPKNTITAKY